MYAFRDVTYFPSSGSIIAVSGYSSNNFNVVIWDTLAPATTSRASILCHEGSALIFCYWTHMLDNIHHLTAGNLNEND